jgi:hypothetical protein
MTGDHQEAVQIDLRLPQPKRYPTLTGRTLMVDMPVIVRHQDRGALRLDHMHDHPHVVSRQPRTLPAEDRRLTKRRHGE